jgi:KipI family sensor histidine kinase inhibitor
VSERVLRVAAAIARSSAGEPFGEPIPAYASVLVPIDVRRAAPAELLETLTEIVDSTQEEWAEDSSPPRRHEFPTRYGGIDGPDLDELAAGHDLRPADVVELHASLDYRVYFLGFAPGFAYLGRVPAEIATPRRATPRPHVAAGSVAIGRDQTGVYPFDTPAGWNVIGRTDVSLWNASARQPALLAPGDMVRFVPIR